MRIPDLSLAGEVALITGGKRGMGREIALAMAAAGADVAVSSRTVEGELKEVADEIRSLGRRSLAVRADVSRKTDVENLVSRVMDEFGTIDILVNSAGILAKAALLETSEDSWRQMIEVNLTGCFLCSQAVGKRMVERKKGTIINMTSDLAFSPVPEMGAYSVSKAGIVILTRVLSKELGKYGIRVNAIAPGLVKTEMSRPNWSDPAVLKQVESMIPLGRIGQTRDVVGAALFLASQASNYITGDTLLLNGGGIG